VRLVSGTRLRAVTIAFWTALALALVAVPVYLDVATARFALRSSFDLGNVVPLMSVSSFGRGLLRLELCLLLFAVAAAVALWVDRPERPRRSIAELLASGGALLAAAAVLVVPGGAGHASQTSPASLAIFLDWLHLVAGSVWVGGLIGLLVLWWSLPTARRIAGLVVSVPRFSNVALFSVLALIGSGTGAALLHLPTLASLWGTSYGLSILAKILILCTTLLLAAVNLLRTKPRLQASRTRPELGPGAASLLRALVGMEVVLVTGAVVAAAILTSLAPPAKALAQIGHAAGSVGPGPASTVVRQGDYTLRLSVDPNKAAVANQFSLQLTRGGAPVKGADVTAHFAMLDMEMGQQAYHLPETGPGVYGRSAPALVMVGHWALTFDVQPPGGTAFSILLLDHATG
jgi:copper transport protein